MKVPVIINNRNLLTWPKAMIEKIKQFKGVGDIWLIDNDSTYEPLIEWMNSGHEGFNILRLSKNLGHTAPWQSGLVQQLRSKYYIVTDGDLDLSSLPNDTIKVMTRQLELNPSLGKVGLGLDWEKVSSASPYYNHMMNYERPRWERSAKFYKVYVDVPVDTTFAIYNRPDYFIGGGSLSHPHVARHLPWEIVDINENEEFKFYIQNANSSSSYKSFLGL